MSVKMSLTTLVQQNGVLTRLSYCCLGTFAKASAIC